MDYATQTWQEIATALWLRARARIAALKVQGRSATHVADFIEEVKAMGFTIIVEETDKQHSLILAVDQVLSYVPHLLCQFNFFRNLAQPVVDADRATEKWINENLKGMVGARNAWRRM